jgi:hypothetical protein
MKSDRHIRRDIEQDGTSPPMAPLPIELHRSWRVGHGIRSWPHGLHNERPCVC